jgi:hypothetical protein
MTDTRWSDVVATALLGTDRRPVLRTPAAAWATPAVSDDPAIQILDLAAQHRSWSRAGSPLLTADPPPTAPATETTWAPASAQELLGRLLDHPEPQIINYWLAACVDRRRHVWPEHWPLLAELATASVDYDRLLLARVIGARGIWFLQQNPAWAGLATQVAAMSEETTPTDEVAEPTSERIAAVQQEIDAVFTATDREQCSAFTAAEHTAPAYRPLHPTSIDRTEASGVT